MASPYHVVVRAGPARGQVLDLSEPITIGRREDNVLALHGDERASRHHARIELRDGELVLTDLESANGTLLNGRRIAGSVTLRPGDVVEVGDTSLVVADAVRVPAASSTVVAPVADLFRQTEPTEEAVEPAAREPAPVRGARRSAAAPEPAIAPTIRGRGLSPWVLGGGAIGVVLLGGLGAALALRGGEPVRPDRAPVAVAQPVAVGQPVAAVASPSGAVEPQPVSPPPPRQPATSDAGAVAPTRVSNVARPTLTAPSPAKPAASAPTPSPMPIVTPSALMGVAISHPAPPPPGSLNRVASPASGAGAAAAATRTGGSPAPTRTGGTVASSPPRSGAAAPAMGGITRPASGRTDLEAFPVYSSLHGSYQMRVPASWRRENIGSQERFADLSGRALIAVTFVRPEPALGSSRDVANRVVSDLERTYSDLQVGDFEESRVGGHEGVGFAYTGTTAAGITVESYTLAVLIPGQSLHLWEGTAERQVFASILPVFRASLGTFQVTGALP
ncbi:MAG: FHA domain-containing protein [Chloroflexi bacterium]|nr:FHA domain-containing protein [Chloroflexota bacterium]